VLVHRRADVQINDRVTAQHQRGLDEEAAEVLDLLHPAGRAHRLGHDLAVIAHALVGIADGHPPAPPVAEILLDLAMLEGHIHHDLGDAEARQVLDDVFHHRLAQYGHHGFGKIAGQRTHPRPLSRCENHAFGHADSCRC
jgi:hypothetical protein